MPNKIKQKQNNLTKLFPPTLVVPPYLWLRICEGGHWLSRIPNKSCRRNIHLHSAYWSRDAVVTQVVLLIEVNEGLALGIAHYLIWKSEWKYLVIISVLEVLTFFFFYYLECCKYSSTAVISKCPKRVTRFYIEHWMSHSQILTNKSMEFTCGSGSYSML